MAAGDMRTFDPDGLSVIVANIPVDGWAAGEFLTIEMESDSFTDTAGSGGEIARVKTMDRRATVKIILLQTSPTNAAFEALHNLDINAPNGAGVGSLMIRDRSGTAMYRADKVWIMKPANISFDRESKSREWIVRVAWLVREGGGN